MFTYSMFTEALLLKSPDVFEKLIEKLSLTGSFVWIYKTNNLFIDSKLNIAYIERQT